MQRKILQVLLIFVLLGTILSPFAEADQLTDQTMQSVTVRIKDAIAEYNRGDESEFSELTKGEKLIAINYYYEIIKRLEDAKIIINGSQDVVSVKEFLKATAPNKGSQQLLDDYTKNIEKLLEEPDKKIKGAKEEPEKEFEKYRGLYRSVLNSVDRIISLKSYGDTTSASFNNALNLSSALGDLTKLNQTKKKYEETFLKYAPMVTGQISDVELRTLEGEDSLNWVIDKDHKTLSEHYLTLIAHTANLEPFKDYITSPAFMDGLNEDTKKLYDKFGFRRKPLYVVQDSEFVKKGKNASGFRVEEITLRNYIKSIKDNIPRVYVLQKGKLEYRPDTNMYVYDTKKTESNVAQLVPSQQTVNFENYSLPVFSSGSFKLEDKNNMLLGVQNNYKDETIINARGANLMYLIAYNSLQNKLKIDSSEMDTPLFMDFLGNVVTANGLVVMPAVNNYLLYKKESEIPILNKAFVNSYPRTEAPGLAELSFNSLESKKKIFFSEQDLKNMFKDKEDKSKEITLSKLNAIAASEFVGNGKLKGFLKSFTIGPEGFEMPPIKATSPPRVAGDSSTVENLFKVHDISGKFVYEYNGVDVRNKTDGRRISLRSIADNSITRKYLIDANYFYLTQEKNQPTNFSNGTLDDNYVIYNVFGEVINGETNLAPYIKNFKENTKIEKDDPSVGFAKLVGGLVSFMYGFFGVVEQNLGLNQIYTNPFVKWLGMYWFEIMIVGWIFLMIIFTYRFIKRQFTIGTLIILSVTSLIFCYVGVSILPKYGVIGYNSLIQDWGKDKSIESLLLQMEENYIEKADKVDKAFKSIGEVDREVKFPSITLYRMSDYQLQDAYNVFGIPVSQLVNGTQYSLVKGGLYMEGDELRYNLKDMFNNVAITGSYENNNENKMVYTYKLQKIYPTEIEYYMPYFQITEEFLKNLNNMNLLTSLSQTTLDYGSGITKDSFIVSNYTATPMFITQDYSHIKDKAIVDRIKKLYPVPQDFLGLSNILFKPKAEYQDTLWFQTIRNNNLLEPSEKVYEKIVKVNEHTKEFMLNIRPQMSYVSDENLIKLITLYAVMDFNNEFSDLNNMLYPMKVNSDETMLDDWMKIFLTADFIDRYTTKNMDIVYYVALKGDVLGLILLGVFLVINYLNTIVLTNISPLLYLTFFVMMFLRFMFNDEYQSLIRGFCKSILIVVLLMAIQQLSFIWVGDIENIFGKMLLMNWISFTIFTLLYGLVIGISRNFTSLGDGMITATIMEKAHVYNYLKNTLTSKWQDYKNRKTEDSIDSPAYERYNINKIDKWDEEHLASRYNGTKISGGNNLSFNIDRDEYYNVLNTLRRRGIKNYKIIEVGEGYQIIFTNYEDYRAAKSAV